MNSLQKFIATGARPGSRKELSAVLDSARNLILQTPKNMRLFPKKTAAPKTAFDVADFTEAELAEIQNQTGGTVLERAHAVYSAKQGRFVGTGKPLNPPTAKPVATAPARRNPAARPAPAASKPTVHRATAAAPKTAAPSAPAQKLTTAAEFGTPELRMDRENFSILSPADKSRFCKTGGKITNQ